MRTVTGDVAPGDLGATYCHEHLLTRPGEHLTRDDPDLVLDDEERAAGELAAFVNAGGRTIVEVTTPEFGRDAAGLRRLARKSGVNVVAVTGHVSEDYWRGVIDLEAAPEEALVEEMVVDLLEGMDGTESCAGIIKVGSSEGRITPTERKIIRAAARAQRETGAPITTHTTAGTAAIEQVRALEAAGADLGRVCIGHIDRRLVWEEHAQLAAAGVFLGYDCISKEKYVADVERARFIAALAARGYGDRICLSGDLARRSYLTTWGGSPGYGYILERFLMLLADAGLDEAPRRALVVENPARLLTWADAGS